MIGISLSNMRFETDTPDSAQLNQNVILYDFMRIKLETSSQTGIRQVGQSQEHKINSVRQQSA